MKAALIALVALVVALTLPVAANAQDWVMDWTSTGHDLFNNWSIHGTSAATLTPPEAASRWTWTWEWAI